MRGCEDTIAAISSAVGESARGLVRLSGPEAVALAEQVFRCDGGRRVADLPGHVRQAGQILIEPEGPLLPAELYLFRSPRSYTGQDLVELHTIGAAPLLTMLLERIVSAGARLADPGEFTARAFFSGKVDLAQAEGVAATVASQSDAQLVAATRLLDGELSRRTRAIGEALADVLALVTAEIDFADEPIEFISSEELVGRVAQVAGQVRELLGGSVAIERMEVLPRVMLVGGTNVGKSCLLNRLTGLERAICSPLAGTTRDVLTAPLAVEGGQVMLIDAAGLVSGGGYGGELERLADEAARGAANEADLLVFVVDLASDDLPGQLELWAELPDRRRLVAANKSDLLGQAEGGQAAWRIQKRTGERVFVISAVTGQGCGELVGAIGQAVHGELADAGGQRLALNARHRQALGEAAEALDRAVKLCDEGGEVLDRAEVLAMELGEAMDQLGGICGQVVTEDLLDRIFANFCVGK